MSETECNEVDQKSENQKFDFMILAYGSGGLLEQGIPKFALDLSEKKTFFIILCDPIFYEKGTWGNTNEKLSPDQVQDLHLQYIQKYAKNPANIKLVFFKSFPGYSLLSENHNIDGYMEINELMRPGQIENLKKLYSHAPYRIEINTLGTHSGDKLGGEIVNDDLVKREIPNHYLIRGMDREGQGDCLWPEYYTTFLTEYNRTNCPENTRITSQDITEVFNLNI